MNHDADHSAPARASHDDEAFGRAIDAIRARIEARMRADDGATDVAYIKRVRRTSIAMEIAGRALIHVSLDPVTFVAGVAALWVHKQLEATEIGHTALHGAFDGLPGAGGFAAKTFRWKTPIDEASWRYAHNIRHHQYTNVVGRDPDIHFGATRLTAQTPHRRAHYVQLATVLADASSFLRGINLHVTGVEDAVVGNGRAGRHGPHDGLDLLPDRSPAQIAGAFRRALRKMIPYYAKEYGLYPALAGPLFWKVALGNWLAETIRDLYSAATIYCGHVGDAVAEYPEGTRAGGRGAWYRMQVEAANNFEVSRPVSILCGALDHQIEHHLFPKLPTNRLREIAPEVRTACREHGVTYRTASWGKTLAGVVRRLARLSVPVATDRPASATDDAAHSAAAQPAHSQSLARGVVDAAVSSSPRNARSPLTR
jgi:fatty acid desaturase